MKDVFRVRRMWVRDIPFGGEPARVVTGGLERDRSGNVLAFPSSTYVQPSTPTVLDLATGAVKVPVDVNPEAAAWPKGSSKSSRGRAPRGRRSRACFSRVPARSPGRSLP